MRDARRERRVTFVNIILRILFQEDAKRALLEDGTFSSEELEGVVLELDAKSERLERFLDATRGTTGSWFNPIIKFTRKELDSSSFFQLEGRKTLEENERDSEWNDRHLETLDPIKTSAGMQIKLPGRIAVSKVSLLKFNMVACVGQTLAEFAVHRDVATVFEAEGLSGYTLRPLYHSKTGEAHVDALQLYSEILMPAAELDRTTLPADGGGLRHIGCLTYRNLSQLEQADFNRTAEDWSSNSMPLWVVSARVRDCFLQNKLKGWAFRPVLEWGSKVHEEYASLWESLFEQVSVNPRNFF